MKSNWLTMALCGAAAAQSGADWTTYHGSAASWHHSTLSQITPANAKDLELKWVWQAQSLEKFETTPLVVNGVMYLTGPFGSAWALDARTGRPFWRYRRDLPNDLTYGAVSPVK